MVLLCGFEHAHNKVQIVINVSDSLSLFLVFYRLFGKGFNIMLFTNQFCTLKKFLR